MPPVGPWLENELAHSINLDGPWQFSLAGAPFTEIPVPAAWEAHIADKITDGPAIYRRAFALPVEWLNRRLLLEFGAVSFDCRITVNGAAAGTHRGLWSAFQLDVTELVQPGDNTIELEVYKPGNRFPPRESLAGFLPDVATTFGGVWQSARLREFDTAVADLRLLQMRRPDGRLVISGAVEDAQTRGPFEIAVELAGVRSASASTHGPKNQFDIALDLARLPRWSPATPALHSVTVMARKDGQLRAQATRSIGCRDVTSVDGRAQIDGRPLHLRGVLDWGWHPDLIRPAPSRDQLFRQFDQARSLGFNLVKLCLFVPDEETFYAADEAGMYLWLEMPLWLPHLTPAVRALALEEYAAVFRRLHHHPCIVVISLGCELNAEADRDFLQALSALARAHFPNTLHCDNSGSAEAYGGVATALSDFYDYHFYTDPHFFQPLVEHFDRLYRPARPWLYGEFCDADTARDFNQLQPEPWWLHEPVALDRDDFLYTCDFRPRLAEAGVTDGGAELTRLARKQATAVRQFILEKTRLHSATGGYIITGWADTPIATSGIVDDHGELKFKPAEWKQFNADAVLLLDRERRRTWERGGDRPSYRDPHGWRQDERPEFHVLLSNGLGEATSALLNWTFTGPDGVVLGHDSLPTSPSPGGEVTELATIFPALPTKPLAAPAECRLSVELKLFSPGWPVARSAQRLDAVGYSPRARVTRPPVLQSRLAERYDWRGLEWPPQTAVPQDIPRDGPWLAETLSTEFLEWVYAGGQAVWWLTEPERITRGLPFWREAIHVFEPHPLWARVPQPGWADMRFFSVATDFALDLAALEATLPASRCRPVWRRFDARALTWADYLIEVQFGAGRIWASTLRFAGGLGRQPAGFGANPWGAWILACLLNP